jgi:hypothetical protein
LVYCSACLGSMIVGSSVRGLDARRQLLGERGRE